MNIKQLIFFSFLLFSNYSFSQKSDPNNWIIYINENVNTPLTLQEQLYIKAAYGNSVYERIVSIKPLEQNIKDILRNRVKILIKKYYPDESIIGLSSVNKSSKSIKFNPKDFNPLIYEFNFDSKNGQIFRVEGTDYIINIIPKQYK
tara:strand:- start:121 stop:558 length:438 start_codon:yes stop_codon:yes gene_type:complete